MPESCMDEEAVKLHVHFCPVGWMDGQIVTHKGTTQADIIEWIRKMRELVGLRPQAEEIREAKQING